MTEAVELWGEMERAEARALGERARLPLEALAEALLAVAHGAPPRQRTVAALPLHWRTLVWQLNRHVRRTGPSVLTNGKAH